MSEQIDDGGPAFPNTGEIFIDGPQGRHPQSAWGMDGDKGMTLRDYFAAAALRAIVAKTPYRTGPVTADHHERPIARGAYAYADAMLAARKEKP
jgi:hypothetical protein